MCADVSDGAQRAAFVGENTGDEYAVLMDSPRMPDGAPIRDGLPYSRIAHLAEGVPAFCDVANLLLSKGYSAPRIFAEDRDAGPTFGARLRVGDVEVAEPGRVENLGDLPVGGPDLLQAQHVSPRRREPLESPASRCRTDPVDVGGDDGEHVIIQPVLARPAAGGYDTRSRDGSGWRRRASS